jgi:hypothetical protein
VKEVLPVATLPRHPLSTTQQLKIRNEVIRDKMKIRETVLGRMKSNAPNWYGHVVAGDLLTWWSE